MSLCRFVVVVAFVVVFCMSYSDCPDLLVLAILSCLSYSDCPDLLVLDILSCLGCPVNAAISGLFYAGCPSWMSCPCFLTWPTCLDCFVLAALCWLSSPPPVLAVLSCLSCLCRLLLAVLSKLPCAGCTVLVILTWLFCPGSPFMVVLFWQSSSVCPLLFILFWWFCSGRLVIIAPVIATLFTVIFLLSFSVCCVLPII